MTIKKRSTSGLTLATPQALTSVGLGAPYGRLLGFNARNWASSAKAGAGTDTAQRIKIVDADSRTVYLDAADRDYATAEVAIRVSADDTATGLGTTPVDATGAAATAGGAVPVIMKSPVVVSVVNGGTTTDFVTVDLLVEV